MIESIRLRNFKCFADTGEIELRPITVLIGLNSSGKSAVFEPLLAMKQTIDSADNVSPMILSGPLVDLGSFKDMVHGHRANDYVTFEFSARPPGAEGTRRPLPPFRNHPCEALTTARSLRFMVTLAYNRETRAVYTKKYLVKTDTGVTLITVSYNEYGALSDVDTELTNDSMPAWPSGPRSVTSTNFVHDLAPTDWQVRERVGSRDQDDARTPIYAAHSLRGATNATLQPSIGNLLFYIGPLREPGERVYFLSGETWDHVGTRGERSIDTLLMQRQTSEWNSVHAGIEAWLERFNIASALHMKRVDPDSEAWSLRLRDSKLNIDAALPDVGFGASQVLPLLIQATLLKPHSMLIAEQPELHLHPGAQAELGDLFIELAGNEVTSLIETHSEHLLLRLRRRIAEDRLNPDDVGLYFVERQRAESTVRRIPIDQYGLMDEWPEDFLSADYQESEARALAAARKAQKEETSG